MDVKLVMTPGQYALVALLVILVAVLLAALLPGGVGWFAAVLFPIAFFIVAYLFGKGLGKGGGA